MTDGDPNVNLPPRYRDVDFSVTLPPWFSPGAGVGHD